MAIKTDPIENTVEYQKAMEKIQPILDEKFPPDEIFMGRCHQVWFTKKELLAKEGIDWKTPSEMNPDVRFD